MLAPETILQERYKVVRQLGQGGMGTVYEAIDKRFDTTVALKETHFTEERLRKQFEREARLLARIRHPAMIRVTDHFQEGDGQFLVMDYISGEDLWEMIQKKDGGFPVDEVLSWADLLLDALDYLHTQEPPIIHRDIKPQNLKLTGRGQIVLLDFGLAKGSLLQTTVVATTKSVLGYSLAYAPLEQILKVEHFWIEALSAINGTQVEAILKGATDQRSDLYSLGATLFHLITGKIPLNAPARALSVWSNRPDHLQAELREHLPGKIAAVLADSMALNPDDRIATAAEMRKLLRDASHSLKPVAASVAETIHVGTILAPLPQVPLPGANPLAPTTSAPVGEKADHLPWIIISIAVAFLIVVFLISIITNNQVATSNSNAGNTNVTTVTNTAATPAGYGNMNSGNSNMYRGNSNGYSNNMNGGYSNSNMYRGNSNGYSSNISGSNISKRP